MDVKAKILMVEDHTSYHKVYKRTLGEALECDIDFATTGEEALKSIESGKYDLVILDYNLPDCSGEQVLLKIRKDPTYSGIPIIFLTGEADTNLQSRLLEYGADDFIDKGATPEVIIARVTVQLRHKMSLDKATEMAMEVEAFTTGVLHDIRNIEHTISSTCYLARHLTEEDPLGNKQEILTYIDNISCKAGELSNYASGIIEQVKTFSNTQIQTVDAQDILDWVKGILGSDILIGIESPLPPIKGDYQLLKLVLLNIIQNSSKYARKSIKPEVKIWHSNLNNQLVELHIDDNGIGIPEGEHRKVFEAFVRGKGMKNLDKKGFGLGLSMVSRAILKMGGKIRAEKSTSFDQGTKMIITLPNATRNVESA